MSIESIYAELNANWLAELDEVKELAGETLAGFEDFFHQKKCFLNPYRQGETASMCAYGTILDYQALSAALKEIKKERISSEHWQVVVNYFKWYGYLSPISTLVACEVARFAGLPSPLE